MLSIDTTSCKVMTVLTCMPMSKWFKGTANALKMLWFAFLRLVMYPKSQQSQNVLSSMSTVFLKVNYRHNILQCCDWYFIGYSSSVSHNNLTMFWLVCQFQIVLKYSHYFWMLWLAFLRLSMYTKSQQFKNVLTSMLFALLCV